MEQIINELVAKLREGWDTVQDEKGLLRKAHKAVLEVVSLVEIVSVEYGLSGEQKAAVAAGVLAKLVNLPFLPEWLERKVFHFAIDAVVHALNKKIGKHWGQA